VFTGEPLLDGWYAGSEMRLSSRVDECKRMSNDVTSSDRKVSF